ncbi:MAG: aspartate-semialdehyde dehydrogenase [Bdellovibrionales bacterium]|nr:aspartate-semialdehyde dehydrogenase [Bdellovibrionales bacterium]
MKLGIVGATGLVGQRFLKLLARLPASFEELRLFSRSQTSLFFNKKALHTQPLSSEGFKGLDICFFSAGADVSRKWAEEAVKRKAIVIDNSSAFREDPAIPLVVPEINSHLLQYKPQIIANPNCTTIQLVTALAPLQKSFQLKSVRVASLQSISGAGKKALDNLKEESRAILEGRENYEKDDLSAAFNCVPYIGAINDEGFCEEEEKIMTESKKILELPDLKISAFTLRVPTLNSHGLVVWLTFHNPPTSLKDLKEALSKAPLIKIQEEGKPPPHGRQTSGRDSVFVGRIRKDPVEENGWILWIVADNLLKGASLNGLQIAEKLITLKREGVHG